MRSTSPTGSTDRIKRLPFKKRVIKLIGRFVFAWMMLTSALLRPWSVDMLGNFMGRVIYRWSRRYRNITLNNLSDVYGHEKTVPELALMAKAVFKHFSREAFQFFRLLSMKPEQVDSLLDMVDFHHLDEALAKGHGCVILTAHYGNWELMARVAALHGYKVNVIARDSDDPGMTGITTRIRQSGGYRVFDRDQPIIGAFRALKNNECLGILPDQNDCDGIMVTFFSMPAATAEGPAVLSLKTGAPIVPVFSERLPGHHYRATAYPAIEYQPTGNHDEDVNRLTQLVNDSIEEQIRRNPTQWLWMHDRWRYAREVCRNAG